MIFYLDENIPRQIAHSLNIIESTLDEGHEIQSSVDAFGAGIKDEDLIPMISEKSGILITHDLKQKTRKRECSLFFEKDVSVFIISFTTGTGVWFKTLKIYNEWERIKKIARRKNRTFVCRILMRGEPTFLFEHSDDKG